MTRSPGSLVSSAAEQSATKKRDDKAFTCRQGGEANLRAATEVNAVSASTTPPVSRPTQLELFPGRACVPKAKPVTIRNTARMEPNRRDGVSGAARRDRPSSWPERPCSVLGGWASRRWRIE